MKNEQPTDCANAKEGLLGPTNVTTQCNADSGQGETESTDLLRTPAQGSIKDQVV